MDMEQMDAAKAARVWQRVQSRESGEPLRPENGSLIRAAVEQAGYYRVLSRAMPGRVGERLRDFARRQQRSADCLRGICRLSGVPLPPEQAGTVRPQQPRQMLERCCREERQLVEEYKPAYLVHGHVHLRYEKDVPRISTLGQTTVINACERYAFDVSDREFPEKHRNVLLWKGKSLL